MTAISGTGPAYLFYLVEAMIDAGILLGLPRATATELIVQTASVRRSCCATRASTPGAARGGDLAGRDHGSAIRLLEEGKVRAAFLAALEAARDRSARSPRPASTEHGAACRSAGVGPAGRPLTGGRPRSQAACPRRRPTAFESTYEGEQGRSEEQWRAWLTRPTGARLSRR